MDSGVKGKILNLSALVLLSVKKKDNGSTNFIDNCKESMYFIAPRSVCQTHTKYSVNGSYNYYNYNFRTFPCTVKPQKHNTY